MISGGSEIREAALDSWLDPVASVRLAKRLGDALADRFRGKVGVFVSLTYDRAKFSGPLECYRQASDQRHVRRFIKRLSWWLGVDLKGKYICKLEFQMQSGVGFPHFHLLIDGVRHIPHDVLSQLWGHGHVWINAITQKRARYFAKYIAKAEHIPAWILGEAPRSVKIIRTSPGFWGRESVRKHRSPVKHDCRPRCWVPIGERLKQKRDVVIARCASGRRGPRYRRIAIPIWRACHVLAKSGVRVVGAGRWLRCEYGLDTLVKVLGSVGGEAAKRRPPDLHSTDSGNPPQPWPDWLVESFRCQGHFVWESES